MGTQGFTSNGKLNIDGQEQDEETIPVTPLASKFAETTNIIISRSTINTTPKEKSKTDSSMQTDTELFFRFIFDYLEALEQRISSGEISIDEILA
jgi:hypothetical protein